MSEEKIVCAAVKLESGTIICGARHWDRIMNDVADKIGEKTIPHEQGFINQFGEFITRVDALDIVKKNGQPFDSKRNVADDELYSEGLY